MIREYRPSEHTIKPRYNHSKKHMNTHNKESLTHTNEAQQHKPLTRDQNMNAGEKWIPKPLDCPFILIGFHPLLHFGGSYRHI